MLALSPGLFWPEDVRRVGSLPANPRKGSVLNDRRQQVPRSRAATGLLREPEGRLGAGAFLASCRWTSEAWETGGRPPRKRRPPPWAARARLAAARGLPSYRPWLRGLPDLTRNLVGVHR